MEDAPRASVGTELEPTEALMAGIKLGAGFKLDKAGKVVRDHAAREAKLDLCTRLKRKNSRKVKVAKRGQT